MLVSVFLMAVEIQKVLRRLDLELGKSVSKSYGGIGLSSFAYCSYITISILLSLDLEKLE